MVTSESTRTLRFGYWWECTKCIQNSRVLTKLGYSRQCTKSIQNSRLLTKFRYRRLRYYDSKFVDTGVMDMMTSMVCTCEREHCYQDFTIGPCRLFFNRCVAVTVVETDDDRSPSSVHKTIDYLVQARLLI